MNSKTTGRVSLLCWKINIIHFNSVKQIHFTLERSVWKNKNSGGKRATTCKNSP